MWGYTDIALHNLIGEIWLNLLINSLLSVLIKKFSSIKIYQHFRWKIPSNKFIQSLSLYRVQDLHFKNIPMYWMNREKEWNFLKTDAIQFASPVSNIIDTDISVHRYSSLLSRIETTDEHVTSKQTTNTRNKCSLKLNCSFPIEVMLTFCSCVTCLIKN